MYTGLDLSLTGTGLANLSSDGKHIYETFKTRSGEYKNRWARIEAIIAHIIKFIKETNTQYVLIEEYMILPKNIQTTIQLVELGAAVRYALYKNGVPFMSVMPVTLKKYATGNGSSKKQVVIKELYKNYNIDTNDDNIADAIYLSMLCRDLRSTKLKKSVKEVVEKILKEREKINWK